LSYAKPCKTCDHTIFLIETNGKWKAFDDATGATPHRHLTCSQDHVGLTLEEHITTIYRILDTHSDRISKLEGHDIRK